MHLDRILMLLFINDFQVFNSQDVVFNWERMLEFRDFSDAKAALFPLVAAHVYVLVYYFHH